MKPVIRWRSCTPGMRLPHDGGAGLGAGACVSPLSARAELTNIHPSFATVTWMRRSKAAGRRRRHWEGGKTRIGPYHLESLKPPNLSRRGCWGRGPDCLLLITAGLDARFDPARHLRVRWQRLHLSARGLIWGA